MRLAALFDIHGNLPALEAVLVEMKQEQVDRVVVGGDVVPGPMPGACLRAIRDLSIPVDSIAGNGEHDAVEAQRGGRLKRVPEAFRPAVRWTAVQLTAQDLEAFDAWPLTIMRTIEGVDDVLFCHATPRDDNEIFTAITPDERLMPVFEPTGAEVILCGHTHMQFDRHVGGMRIINAGSVGMPFGEPGAYWALIGPDGIELRRTDYDLDAAAKLIAESGYPAELDLHKPPSEADMLKLLESAAIR